MQTRLDLSQRHSESQLRTTAFALRQHRIDIVSCHSWRNAKPWALEERFVPDSLFLFPWRGRLRFYVEGRSLLIEPGSYVVAPDYLRHAIELHEEDGELEQIALHAVIVDANRVPLYRRTSQRQFSLVETASTRKQLEELAWLMAHDQEAGNVLGRSVIRLLVAEAIAQGCDFDEQQIDEMDPRIRGALARMQNGFGDPRLTVEGLAWQAKMSEAGFRLRFRQSVGQSPKAYLTSLRLQRATRLLVETELTIARIASQVGFASPQHFHAVFRSQLHCTPATYRKNRVIGL